jgi:hypothetical protein
VNLYKCLRFYKGKQNTKVIVIDRISFLKNTSRWVHCLSFLVEVFALSRKESLLVFPCVEFCQDGYELALLRM